MKKLLTIATADDGSELTIGRDGDDIGIMITTNSEAEPFIVPNDPDWLEKKFGSEALKKAKQTLDYLRFKYGKDDAKKLFESITPDILKVINNLKQEEGYQ